MSSSSSCASLVRPLIHEQQVKEFCLKLYGLRVVQLTELNGYDDKNYRIFVEREEENQKRETCEFGYVLKITNTLDSKNLDFMDATNGVLLLLEKKGIGCPKPVRNLNGDFFSLETLESGKHVFRLMEFQPGEVLLNVRPYTNRLFYECGQLAARIDLILKDFSHKAYENRKSLWNLESVPELKQYLHAVKDDSKRKLVEEIIGSFEDRVLSKLDELEKGIIHGDINESNLLVGVKNGDKMAPYYHLSAILDFGDSSHSCYLFELAIAMTYMIILSKDLKAGGYVLAGYKSIKDLPNEEINLLKVCIMARLCQSLVMGAYTALKDPDNAYVLTTQKNGWKVLENLRETNEEDVLKTWKSVTESDL